MGPRPSHLNLHNDPSGTPQPPRMNFYMDLPSPRTGEAPPALSPLDAFALHSRILAQQFKQEAQSGRRISRLPHVAVAKELANRPDFFRNASGGSDSAMSTMSEVPEVQEEFRPTTREGVTVGGGERFRPVSHYPMLGHASKASRSSPAVTPYYDAEESQPKMAPQDYFGMGVPRALSPEPVGPNIVNIEGPSPPMMPSLTHSMDSVSSSQPRTFTNGSTHSQRSQRSDRGLLPPKSPGFPKSPRSMQSIRSVPPDSGDEDGFSYSSAYATSASRKFSGSSNMSRSRSPFSPYMAPVHRSPSMTSEYSVNGSQAQPQGQKARCNFSRPRSSGGQSVQSVHTRPSFETRPSLDTRPSNELPLRKSSLASNSTHPSSFHSNPSTRQNSADDVRTPANVHLDTPGPETAEAAGNDYFGAVPAGEPNATPSYIYTKYSLPRGRTAIERNSAGMRDSWIQNQFTWDESKPPPPISKTNAVPVATNADVFHQRQRDDSNVSTFSAPVRPSSPTGSTGSDRISGMWLSTKSRPAGRSATRSRSANPEGRFEKPHAHRSSPSVDTESTIRTIKAAVPLHQRASSTELTPEEHLELGIETHSSGDLTKSTYHLRLAAKAGLPTAMLLYALACRHGWGIRPNAEEGVLWLRKAVEGSSLEGVNLETALSSASQATKVSKGVGKAQFALAIYELGISYMNGWGCAKDKPLALRCYEVAGSWGDCDALAEAGYCWTQGVGCRKDLSKAAGLYRKAADGGMSMAGNSWIYKAKYMDNDATAPAPVGKSPEKQKLHRTDTAESATDGAQKPGRSRGRSLWGRKKEKA
ncbi:hypothetical protein LTR36_003323 [Oleoguttula mirabilis]|uniref:Uncharacterized protein n=1 Tax=Oleoguttula mirabilis TaxID=1507867 RepID=A0AAV9JZ09_9PEZI|nr:hypothetical protein LTR36_003323 [Oleoguttula mirabilis]